jgi:DNA-binding response OmpR family regulator
MTLAEENSWLKAEVANLREAIASITTPEFIPPNEPEHFTPSERRILSLLFANQGKPVRHTAIWQALYGLRNEREQPDSNITKVLVSKTRRKLKNHRIEPVWCVGYRLVKVRS